MDIVQNLSFNYTSPSFVSYRTYLSIVLCAWVLNLTLFIMNSLTFVMGVVTYECPSWAVGSPKLFLLLLSNVVYGLYSQEQK
jgi:hypothetical protein